MGVLYILYISHKNFNRPLGETPALSHPELVSGWIITKKRGGGEWNCLHVSPLRLPVVCLPIYIYIYIYIYTPSPLQEKKRSKYM